MPEPLSDEQVVGELTSLLETWVPKIPFHGRRGEALSQAIERFGPCECGKGESLKVRELRRTCGWTFCPACGRRLVEVPHAAE